MSLNPKVKAKVGVTKSQIKYIAGRRDDLTYDQVFAIIQKILEEVLEITLRNLEFWIEERVPKRTGQLQKNLLLNLKSSRVRNGILRLIIGTAINYAEEVNQMSSAQVRHHGTWKEHSGKWAYAYYGGHYGKIFLDDPKAEGNFFEKLVAFAKRRIIINLATIKKKYLGGQLLSKDLEAYL